MSFFVHPQGICESEQVGEGTRIWAFAHVLPGAVLGRDCNICDHVFIENDVRVGDRVTVKCGVQLWDGVRLGDDVFVGPSATFTNDGAPRSKRHQQRVPETRVETGASIGANATILPGITIGRQAMVGAGAVVTGDVPAHAMVVGNPAHIYGYADAIGGSLASLAERQADSAATSDPGALPGGARMIGLIVKEDLRGSLAALEHADLPFVPQRTFVVHGVPSQHVRGQHAHRECHQFLVCLRGSLSVVLDDTHGRVEVALAGPERGLYVPPMIWATQYRFAQHAVLLVLASHPYDPDDYIRDYEQYRGT